MTTILDRTPSTDRPVAGPKSNVRLPASVRNRRSAMALASVVVVCLSIALFTEVYASADHRSSALIVTGTIAQGQLIRVDQLGQTSVAVSGGIAPIPVSDLSELSGKRAAVTIPAGSLLTSGDVTGAAPIAAGGAVVGLALKAGQLPSAGVEAGDQVMIVETAAPGTPLTSSDPSGSSSTGVLVPEATVFDVEVPPAGSASDASLLVSVEVSSTLAAAVSTAAVAGQVSLVLLPPRSVGSVGGGSGQATGGGGSGGSSP
jgi:hypothetical protein